MALRRPETLTEAVIDHVRNSIISGAFPPGSPLPEARLAVELGTSRGTVREAMRALAEDGLVDLHPHRAVRVSSISLRGAREIYEVREVLEPFAVRLGVTRGALRDATYAGELRAVLERLRRAVHGGDQAEIVEEERALHRLMWMACDQEVLIDTLSALQVQTRRILVYTRAYDRGDVEIEEHASLVDAALSGDPDRAEAATREHLVASRNLMLERMERLEQDERAGRDGRDHP